MTPTFFATPEAFRKWLAKHHAQTSELLVGFYKKGSGIPSMTWPESVDQALCFGWIDGIRRRIDDERYSIRFTPRKPKSTWSSVNIARVAELTRLGMIQPAGLRAFEQRSAENSGIYAYENAARELPPEFEKQFRKQRKAWQSFSEQPPSYRRVAIHWVTSAKKQETRTRRLATLIEDSAAGRRLAIYTLTPKKG